MRKIYTRIIMLKDQVVIMNILIVAITCYLSACTLDFDEFEPYTDPSAYAGTEVQMPDNGVDMIIRADQLMPDQLMPDQIIPPMLDRDEDGINDELDNCIEVANPQQADGDMDGKGDACDDDDNDGVLDYITQEDGTSITYDNCIGVPNTNQKDSDLDQIGDACDEDIDGDTISNVEEEMQGLNAQSADSDQDGFRDDLDLCPLVTSRLNIDSDMDGKGDACDNDDDDDGILDWSDVCPYIADADQALETQRGIACLNDLDSDGIIDEDDPCPFEPVVEEVHVCTLAVQRWGFDGNIRDFYTSQKENVLSVWYASAGGLYHRELSSQFNRAEEGLVWSWGEESGLWSRNIYKVQSMNERNIWWVLSDIGLSTVHWDGLTQKYYVKNISHYDSVMQGELTDLLIVENQVIVSTTQGLYHISSSEINEISIEMLDTPSVSFLELGLGNKVWFAVESTLYYYDVTQAEQGATAYGAFADLGTIKAMHMAADESLFWLLSTTYAQLMNYDNPAPVLRIELNTYDALYRGNGHYLATDEGVTWIDQSARTYPSVTYQLNQANIKQISAPSSDDSLWIATDAGLIQAEDLWISQALAEYPCIRDSYKLDFNTWILSSSAGILTMNAQGVIENLYEGNFYDMQKSANDVWAVSDTDLVRINAEGVATSYTIPDFSPPYSALLIFNDQLWVGNESGVAYSTLTEGSPNQWSLLFAENEEYLYSGIIKKMSYYNGSVWIAVSAREGESDTEGGVSQYILANGAFDNLVYRQNNGIIPSNYITDLSITATRTIIATEAGTLIFAGNLTSREVLRLNSGLPIEVGDSYITSILDLGDVIWFTLSSGSSLVYGGLITFETELNAYLMDETRSRVYTYKNHDGLLSQDIESMSLRNLSNNQREYQLGLHTCGSMENPGGVSTLNRKRSVKRNLKETKLRGTGINQRLIPSSRDPYVAYINQVEKIDTSRKTYIQDLYTDVQSQDEMLDPPTPSTYAAEFNAPIVGCLDYRLANELSKRIRCLLSSGYFVYFDNNQWYRDESATLTEDIIVSDLLLDPNNLANQTWIASNQGLIVVRNQQLTKYNVMNTMNAFPNDQVNALAYNPIDKRLYIGTDQGMVSLDLGVPLPADISMVQWQNYPALDKRKINALSVNETSGELWVATDVSLAVLRQGMVTEYGVQDGLLGIPIRDVLVDETGPIWLAHASGISKYTNNEWQHYGPRHGFNGSASQLMIDGTRQLWVLSDHGVSALSLDSTGISEMPEEMMPEEMMPNGMMP